MCAIDMYICVYTYTHKDMERMCMYVHACMFVCVCVFVCMHVLGLGMTGNDILDR